MASNVQKSDSIEMIDCNDNDVIANNGNNYRFVGIFWDIENCNIPKHKDVNDLVKAIRMRAIDDYSNDEIKQFECVCNTNKLCPQTIKRLADVKEERFNLIQVNSRPNSADNKLIQHIRIFIKDNMDNSANKVKIVIISSDSDFIEIINEAKDRGCDVSLICRPNKFTKELLERVDYNRIIDYNEILDNVRNGYRYAKKSVANEKNRFHLSHNRVNTYRTSRNYFAKNNWSHTTNGKVLAANRDTITKQPNRCHSSRSNQNFVSDRHSINVVDDEREVGKCDACLDVCCRVCNCIIM